MHVRMVTVTEREWDTLQLELRTLKGREQRLYDLVRDNIDKSALFNDAVREFYILNPILANNK